MGEKKVLGFLCGDTAQLQSITVFPHHSRSSSWRLFFLAPLITDRIHEQVSKYLGRSYEGLSVPPGDRKGEGVKRSWTMAYLHWITASGIALSVIDINDLSFPGCPSIREKPSMDQSDGTFFLTRNWQNIINPAHVFIKCKLQYRGNVEKPFEIILIELFVYFIYLSVSVHLWF